MSNVILTDADGVLLNWEYAFDVWMQNNRGIEKLPGVEATYEISERYGVSYEQGRTLISRFNESAHMGFLPPLRDAMHYVRKLHEEHGFVFHVITSMSTDPSAGKLRTMNLKKLFGETAIERFVYLDTGADKDAVLAEYKDTEYLWVEDKPENAIAGQKCGLNPVLIEHGYNMNDDSGIPRVKGWKDIYEMVAQEIYDDR